MGNSIQFQAILLAATAFRGFLGGEWASKIERNMAKKAPNMGSLSRSTTVADSGNIVKVMSVDPVSPV